MLKYKKSQVLAGAGQGYLVLVQYSALLHNSQKLSYAYFLTMNHKTGNTRITLVQYSVLLICWSDILQFSVIPSVEAQILL